MYYRPCGLLHQLRPHSSFYPSVRVSSVVPVFTGAQRSGSGEDLAALAKEKALRESDERVTSKRLSLQTLRGVL